MFFVRGLGLYLGGCEWFRDGCLVLAEYEYLGLIQYTMYTK